jgi:carbonic anhydrase
MTNTHSCQAIVVSCMDFRLRKHLRDWTTKTVRGGYDRLALTGGIKDLSFVLDQIELSVKLHNTYNAYLINHEDCGAYGAESNYKRHKKDLLFAKKIIKQKFRKLKIYLLYLKLNGEFINVS